MVKYSARYEARWDTVANEWLEPKCSDPNCRFCKNRPATPLDEDAGLNDADNEVDN